MIWMAQCMKSCHPGRSALLIQEASEHLKQAIAQILKLQGLNRVWTSWYWLGNRQKSSSKCELLTLHQAIYVGMSSERGLLIYLTEGGTAIAIARKGCDQGGRGKDKIMHSDIFSVAVRSLLERRKNPFPMTSISIPENNSNKILSLSKFHMWY